MRILTIFRVFIEPSNYRYNYRSSKLSTLLYCIEYFNHRFILCVLRLQHSKVKDLFLYYFKATSILLKV